MRVKGDMSKHPDGWVVLPAGGEAFHRPCNRSWKFAECNSIQALPYGVGPGVRARHYVGGTKFDRLDHRPFDELRLSAVLRGLSVLANFSRFSTEEIIPMAVRIGFTSWRSEDS